MKNGDIVGHGMMVILLNIKSVLFAITYNNRATLGFMESRNGRGTRAGQFLELFTVNLSLVYQNATLMHLNK